MKKVIDPFNKMIRYCVALSVAVKISGLILYAFFLEEFRMTEGIIEYFIHACIIVFSYIKYKQLAQEHKVDKSFFNTLKLIIVPIIMMVVCFISVAVIAFR